MSLAYDQEGALHSVKGIRIRNLWLLMLYASECFAHIEHTRSLTGRESLPEDEHWPDIIAELLVYFVRERLLRGLTRSYLQREADLPRVRGSINTLRTETHQLLARGRVACRFQEPTLNTPRNRLVRAALERGTNITQGPIASQCRNYASLLFRMGVCDGIPDRYTLAQEVDTISTRDDRMVVAAARLLLEMAIPQTRSGDDFLPLPSVNERWLRGLFEKALRGFYSVVAKDWTVERGNVLQDWPVLNDGAEIKKYLPGMELDIVLRHRHTQHKSVIDAKFTSLLKSGWFRDEGLSSAYIYQMYAYLRSQEEKSEADRASTGILLHPAIEKSQYFSCAMQGHRFIFTAINLNATAQDIRSELMEVLAQSLP